VARKRRYAALSDWAEAKFSIMAETPWSRGEGALRSGNCRPSFSSSELQAAQDGKDEASRTCLGMTPNLRKPNGVVRVAVCWEIMKGASISVVSSAHKRSCALCKDRGEGRR
jgi:hypothetical protein